MCKILPKSVWRQDTLILFHVQVTIPVQFSRSVISDSLQPHGLQQARLSCPSPTARACSNSCPLSRWCHPTISSSVVPLSSCLQSFPASGSFPKSQFFHQVAKVLELQFQHQSLQWIFRTDFLQDWLVGSPWGTLKGTLKSLLQHHNSKASTLHHSAFFMIQHFHD